MSEEDNALVQIIRPPARYKKTAQGDAREVFQNHAAFLADAVMTKITDWITSDDPVMVKMGMEMLAKYRKNIWKDQPTESVKKVEHTGVVSEEFFHKLQTVLNGGKANESQRRMVEAEARVVETLGELAGKKPQRADAGDSAGDVRPLPVLPTPRIPNGPVPSSVGTGEQGTVPPNAKVRQGVFGRRIQ